MNIELFSIEEYEELIALWDRCRLHYDPEDRDSREKMEQQVFDDHVVILTLKTDEGRIIGSVIGSFDGRKAWINRLAVDPEYRARRLAARLMEKAEAMLAERGARVFAALIEEENFPSMGAFKYSGYEGWDGIIYFRKKLK